MNSPDSLTAARAEDLIKQCGRSAAPRFGAFLDGAEQAVIEDRVSFYGFNMMLYGGYKDAERRILGVFPEWEEPRPDAFPISVLKITSGFGGELSHRDYLGSLMAQGIDRSKTGDIIIDGKTAYIFVCEDIAAYLADNIKKIGSRGVKIAVTDASEAVIPEPKRERVEAVCASERLDAVVAALCGISRSESARLINASLVKLNHRECADVSASVAENDLISVRGHGRFVFLSGGSRTRKGRLHITAEKYI